MKKATKPAAAVLVRVVGSKPKKSAPFAPDLAVFTFERSERSGRAFECTGFSAVTSAQLAGLRLVQGSAAGGAVKVTPAQRARLVKLAREHAPYWTNVRAEVA